MQKKILVVDVVMPKIDGFQVCRKMKSSSAMQDIQALPLLLAWLSGISNLRGEILSVVDLAYLLSKDPEEI